MSQKSNDLVVTKPERLSVDANTDGLIEVKIQLRNRVVVVREASYADGLVRGQLIGKLLDEQEANTTEEGTAEMTRQNMIINLWAPLYSCSSGDVPERDEFMRMSEKDIGFWIETARELNPDWFGWLKAIENLSKEAIEAENKKKAQKPPE